MKETGYDERQTALTTLLFDLPQTLETDAGTFALKGMSAGNTKDEGVAQVLCRTNGTFKAPDNTPLMKNLEARLDEADSATIELYEIVSGEGE